MKRDNKKEENEQTSVVIGLSHILADTYNLYLKTQNYHWNVRGPIFSNYTCCLKISTK